MSYQKPDRIRIQQSWIRRQQQLNRIKADYLRGEAPRSERLRSEPSRYHPGRGDDSPSSMYDGSIPIGSTADHQEAWPEHVSLASKTKADLLEMLILQNAITTQQTLLQQMTSRPPETLPPSDPYWRPPTTPRPSSYPRHSSLPPIKLTPLVTTDQYSPPDRHSHISRHTDSPTYQNSDQWIKTYPGNNPWYFPSPSPTREEPRTRPLASNIPDVSLGLSAASSTAAPTAFTAAKEQSDKSKATEAKLFEEGLLEVLQAIQYIYRDPEKRIMKVLNQLMARESFDLTQVFSVTISAKQTAEICENMAIILENVIFELTEIMPESGVLGTNSDSGIYRMLESLQHYPPGYFDKVEMTLLEDSAQSGTITDDDKVVLLTGMFLGRALTLYLLLKPVQFKLTTKPLSELTTKNLKMLATLFFYLLRILYRQPGAEALAVVPPQLEHRIFTDLQMAEIFGKLKKTFDYCEKLMRSWCREYVKRINNASQF